MNKEEIKLFIKRANTLLALKIIMDGYDDGYTDGVNDVLEALAATIGMTREDVLNED